MTENPVDVAVRKEAARHTGGILEISSQKGNVIAGHKNEF